MSDKEFLNQNGYIVKRSFFNTQEVLDLQKLSKSLHSNNDKIVNNLHNQKEAWNLIVNSKIKNFLKNIYNEKDIYYLYNSHSVVQRHDEKVDDAWHRDNACRVFGVGPDWSGNYNVIRVAIYLNDENKIKTGLNLMPNSHNGKGYVCSLLRYLRTNMKRIYFNRIFRFCFDYIFGKKIYTNEGDCVFFYANMYHSAIRSKNIDEPRKAIFSTYGTNNLHADNFLNYYLYYHHVEHNFDTKKNSQEEFLNYLEKNGVNSKLPTSKKSVEGFTI